ncbi:MAG: type II toxin-antitoxin system HicB family antitoxin [Ignavibacteria bacterium]|jgi:predicted RNase H-like HicB family nuclease|nr:type II toxin-antitoxin system HicB family antitoxin [Ignavibacteria bacterium]
MKLTVKISEGKNNFLIGQIKEIPSVLTQGKTINEVKENIKDALELYLQDMREEKSNENEHVVLEEELIY